MLQSHAYWGTINSQLHVTLAEGVTATLTGVRVVEHQSPLLLLGSDYAKRRAMRGMELCRNLPSNNGGWLGRGFTGVYQGGVAVEKQSFSPLPRY